MIKVGNGVDRFSPWWIKEDVLACGCHPSRYPGGLSKGLRGLLDAGFKCFFDVTERKEHDGTMIERHGANYPDYSIKDILEEEFHRSAGIIDEKIRYASWPLVDADIPTVKYMQQLLDALDDVVKSNAPVYLHCGWAIGRAPLVAACWQISHGARADDVLSAFPKRWGHNLPHTKEQEIFVQEWEW